MPYATFRIIGIWYPSLASLRDDLLAENKKKIKIKIKVSAQLNIEIPGSGSSVFTATKAVNCCDKLSEERTAA